MQLFDIRRVAAAIGFSPATITHWAYRRRPAPNGFPEPIHVGRQLRYIKEEVDTWVASRAAARPGQQQNELANTTVSRRRGRPCKSRQVDLIGGAK